MKHLLTALAASLALATATAQAGEVSVAASAVPHAEILELIKPQLAKQGIELKIKVFTDYVQPNLQVEEGRINANYFQTLPYLDEFNRTHGTHLSAITGVHIEPFGAYSSTVKSLDALPEGAQVVIPNDASNGGRALLLLQTSGLITLKEGVGSTANPKDIVSNPKKLKIRELEAPTLARVLSQVDLALINTNYALEAGLNPVKDALLLESGDSPYVNQLVARDQDKDNADLKALADTLRSPEVRTFIETRYKGAVLPAF